MSEKKEEESGWLIEVEGPRYLACYEKFRDFMWTEDSNKALRFSRKEDADSLLLVANDKFQYLFKNVNPKSVEHGWG